MKKLLLCGLALSLTAYANTQGSGYAPNDGTARPGNPGTFSSKAKTPEATSAVNTGTDLGTGMENSTDPTTESGNANLERINTSPNPIPEDTTLHGEKQSQEEAEEKLDYRAIPKVDHSDQNASENQ